jgi:hypothetical protein
MRPIKKPTKKQYKLGFRPSPWDDRNLLFGDYLDGDFTPPKEVNWAAFVKWAWGMYANDRLGDCVVAAAAHMIILWFAVNGIKKMPTVAEVIAFYKKITPGGGDAGADLIDALKLWAKEGLSGDKIHAYASVQIKDVRQAKAAIHLFSNLYIGANLPDGIFAGDALRIEWAVPKGGPVGKWAPNPDNGHAINGVAYDETYLYVVTWGALKRMTWEFFEAYGIEHWTVLDLNWLKDGKAPNGFDLEKLEADLGKIHMPKSPAILLP